MHSYMIAVEIRAFTIILCLYRIHRLLRRRTKQSLTGPPQHLRHYAWKSALTRWFTCLAANTEHVFTFPFWMACINDVIVSATESAATLLDAVHETWKFCMKPPKCKYTRAETAQQAVETLCASDGEARILAGGQSLIPALSARSIAPSLIIDIMRCPGLEQVSETSSAMVIGAACRQAHIEHSSAIRKSIPLLSEVLTWVAMPQVRSRGTVVGCLAQANAGGEVPVAAVALDAEVEILSAGGVSQQMSAADFYSIEAGTRLPSSSLIVSASFQTRATGEGWGFSEIQLRQGHFALVCCAVTLLLDENGHVRSARIALGGLTANPYRARSAEKGLVGEAAKNDSVFRDAAHMAARERPWSARSDLHASAGFRSKVAVVAVSRALETARSRCTAGRENT